MVAELPGPAPFNTPGHPNDVAVVESPRARAAAVFMASTHLRNNRKLALPTSSKTRFFTIKTSKNVGFGAHGNDH